MIKDGITIRAYLLSCGEATTDLAFNQLKRYGLDVILLDGKESMQDKYKRFIKEAKKRKNEKALKIDADVIVNENIKFVDTSNLTQFKVYNFYTNSVTYNGVTCYHPRVINTIYNYLDNLNWVRPETSAIRLSETKGRSSDIIVGLHGFFQNKDDIDRVEITRKFRKHPFDKQFIEGILKI